MIVSRQASRMIVAGQLIVAAPARRRLMSCGAKIGVSMLTRSRIGVAARVLDPARASRIRIWIVAASSEMFVKVAVAATIDLDAAPVSAAIAAGADFIAHAAVFGPPMRMLGFGVFGIPKSLREPGADIRVLVGVLGVLLIGKRGSATGRVAAGNMTTHCSLLCAGGLRQLHLRAYQKATQTPTSFALFKQSAIITH
jgi:hypothetical protein